MLKIESSARVLHAAVAPLRAETRAEASVRSASAVSRLAPLIGIDGVGRSHQIDNLFTTHWKTTRCSAASAVAMAALTDKPYVEALAAFVVRNLEARVAALWDLVVPLDGKGETRRAALQSFLPELQRHIRAFKLTMPTALAELGYAQSREAGQGVGIPPHAGEAPVVISDGHAAVELACDDLNDAAVSVRDAKSLEGLSWYVRDGVSRASASAVEVPATRRKVPWYRDVEGKGIVLQTKNVDLAIAGQMLALYQVSGAELALVDRVLGCLESELSLARITLEVLQRTSVYEPETLQTLADTLLVAVQNSASGLNAAETGAALNAAGLQFTSLRHAVRWENLGRAALPGTSVLLDGRGHAITFGRLRDGRTFLYDSEGILSDRNNACLRFVKPGEDPAIDAHYGVFKGTHRCGTMRIHNR